MSPPHGSFRKTHNSSHYSMPVGGLKLGTPYMFGIFAELDSGKRTDVRSVIYKTRKIFRKKMMKTYSKSQYY